MSVQHVRTLWRTGKVVRAAWMSSPDGLIAAIMAHAGLDLLVLDMQDGMAIGPDRVAGWLQAVDNADVAALVRVPWNDPVHIQYVLDAGADGVIVPLITTPEEATRATGACRYPPLGYRSFGPNRARFRAGADPIRWGNEQILCFALLEHISAVERVEEIARLPGLDGLFIGPNDLGLSMGLAPGQRDDRHAAACRRILVAGQAAGKVVGYFGGGGVVEARERLSEGFTFCPVASDIGLIEAGLAAAMRALEG